MFRSFQLKRLLLLPILGALGDASAQALDTQIDAYLAEAVQSSGIPGLAAAAA